MSEQITGPSVPPIPGEWIHMTGVGVSGGRLHPPKKEVESAGIAESDIVAVVIEADGTPIIVGERPVNSGKRISVPQAIVDAHGLDGQLVDVWLHDTGFERD